MEKSFEENLYKRRACYQGETYAGTKARVGFACGESPLGKSEVWVIMTPNPVPLYVKQSAALGVTARSAEADKFETEMEATKRLLELRLPRDWMVLEQS